MRTAHLAAVAMTVSVGLSVTSTAAASVTLAAGESGCDLFSTSGCLMNHTGGGSFDDPAQIVAGYNAGHAATPSPEDLPTLTLLGKAEDVQANGDVTFTDNGDAWVFSNLPWFVSYYAVKAGPNQIQLFGIAPASKGFTATNSRILVGRGNIANISHVTFFGAPGGAVVPEPSAWALMLLGFGGAGAMLRRRKTAIA